MAFYSAQIAAGSTTVVTPSYYHMTFASVQGADAVITTGGDLQFATPTLWNSVLSISITMVNQTHFIGLFYQWDGGTILPLVTPFSSPGNVPVTQTAVIRRTGTTLAFYTNVDVASTAAWGVGFVTPIGEHTVFPPDGTQMTFSEQPSQLIRVDAVIADGSYTSSSINDLTPMPFSYIRFGPAAIDPYQNLQFSDIVIDDYPQLTMALQVATAPANNYIWGQWDYSGTAFLITETHLATTGTIWIANIPIVPPNFGQIPDQYGQGHFLQLSISCSVPAVFNWSGGHVFGIEASLASGPVEFAPINPSIVGRTYTSVGNSIAGGNWGPPIGPPFS